MVTTLRNGEQGRRTLDLAPRVHGEAGYAAWAQTLEGQKVYPVTGAADAGAGVARAGRG